MGHEFSFNWYMYLQGHKESNMRLTSEEWFLQGFLQQINLTVLFFSFGHYTMKLCAIQTGNNFMSKPCTIKDIMTLGDIEIEVTHYAAGTNNNSFNKLTRIIPISTSETPNNLRSGEQLEDALAAMIGSTGKSII
ncbi:hypothetical protein ACJX0J_010147 [Zea mays]